jgi:hypothetical protein
LGSSTRASIISRSELDSGARPLLRGVKAHIDGLTPNILVMLSVASRSFLVHRRKVIRPSTFQATQDMSGAANAASTCLVPHHMYMESNKQMITCSLCSISYCVKCGREMSTHAFSC